MIIKKYYIYFLFFFFKNFILLAENELNKKKWGVIRDNLWKKYKEDYKRNPNKYKISQIIIEDNFIKNKNKKMPYVLMKRGKVVPIGGWSLFISLHGGGGNSRVSEAHSWDVNDREWEAQKVFVNRGTFSPEGFYFIPRMTDDRVGRWVSLYNLEIFKETISELIVRFNINPNKVYIMGISQGGYGTSYIAPLFADYFAAANAMAGGMKINVENLFNLPFRSDIGEFDTMFNRIEFAKQSHQRLENLFSKYKDYYINKLVIQKGRGHGIDYSGGAKWMVNYERNPYPKKIIWSLDKKGFLKTNFYWIGIRKKEKYNVRFKTKIEVDVKDNVINISALQNCSKSRRLANWTNLEIYDVVVNLSDDIVDLDKKVIINLNGVEKINKKLERSKQNLMKTMINRNDKYYSFPVQVVLD